MKVQLWNLDRSFPEEGDGQRYFSGTSARDGPGVPENHIKFKASKLCNCVTRSNVVFTEMFRH